jgi:hypothetical protein
VVNIAAVKPTGKKVLVVQAKMPDMGVAVITHKLPRAIAPPKVADTRIARAD